MEASNAFDLLILPILEWFAGILATLPIIQALRVGIGHLFARPARAGAGRPAR